jgi:membrane-bound lytic murein transglycosylase D
MTIRAWLLLVAGCLFPIAAPGGVTRVAAAAASAPYDEESVEMPAAPHVVDGPRSMDLSVQPSAADGGSEAAAYDTASFHPSDVLSPGLHAAGTPQPPGSLAFHPSDVLSPELQALAAAEAAAYDTAVTVHVDVSATRSTAPYMVVITPQVQYFLERFTTTRRDIVGLWLNRSRQYLGMIRDVFKRHGLPEDLAFVAMIESGFNPLAVSRAGAKGLWQFMAGTARRYGLRVDHWVDERYDPEKSTWAAAAYLRDLYNQFGSWSLAKAAYNAGEMKIVNAIRAVGSNDFWTLARSRFLQQETKEFVPAIHAATVIGRDPMRYGFDLTDRDPAATETVTVPPATNLHTLAQSSGLSLERLRALNPVLLRGVTPPGTPFELKIPAGTRDGVLRALQPPKRAGVTADHRGKTSTSQPERSVHVVRPRETVGAIAKHYGISVDDLRRWNGLDGDLIRPGDRLRVAEVHLTAERPRSSGIR